MGPVQQLGFEGMPQRLYVCTPTRLGTWLDWQTQGTRVSRNLYYRNNRDLFVEVSHGPYLVEHNVLGSRASLESFSQGGAARSIYCVVVSAGQGVSV